MAGGTSFVADLVGWEFARILRGGGEVTDCRTYAAESVQAGRGQVAREAKFLKQRRLGREDLRRRGITVEVAEQNDQAADER